MTTETILYIIIAGVISIALAIFMYGYKSKIPQRLRYVLATLRSVGLFAILLLIINPEFKNEIFLIEKPKLPVLIDNSLSVNVLEQENAVLSVMEQLQENPELNDKFDISYFTFGSEFRQNDSLSFSDKNTNISKALSSIDEIFGNLISPTVLITDGNQTLGNDYEFSSANFKNHIYPVILGDSTQYTDLKIDRLNTNRYAFLKNRFPVEVMLNYSGKHNVESEFVITKGSSTLHREKVSFSESKNSKTIELSLPSEAVGLQKYTAQILPVDNEKNTTNNVKQFAVEVIDQATNVLIISELSHPDLGALIKSITTNEQRLAELVKPSEAVPVLNDYQLVILYQPNRSFGPVFSEMDRLGKNSLIISGLKTEWNFLNQAQTNFRKNTSNQRENIQASLNSNYGTFAVEDLGFDGFPPLQTQFGELSINVPNEMLLEQTVHRIATESPLLATMEINGRRHAVWDGEGFWRWRADSYLKSESFQDFDGFIGSLIQYLASNKRKNRLEVSSETFYYNNSPIKISSQYFDKNYVFDNRASLNINVVNAETEQPAVFPMLLRNNFYEVDLSNLPAGEYSYTVTVADEAISASGNFTILDFNVEQQFLNADFSKLQRLAHATQGNAYFASQGDLLVNDLISNIHYKNIERSELKTVPLIDWKFLLAIIALVLALEWFIRKYNGLI